MYLDICRLYNPGVAIEYAEEGTQLDVNATLNAKVLIGATFLLLAAFRTVNFAKDGTSLLIRKSPLFIAPTALLLLSIYRLERLFKRDGTVRVRLWRTIGLVLLACLIPMLVCYVFFLATS